jgi:hypothetical protein
MRTFFYLSRKGTSIAHSSGSGSGMVMVNPSKRISCIDCDATELRVMVTGERRHVYEFDPVLVMSQYLNIKYI